MIAAYTYDFGVVEHLQILGLGPFEYLGHTVELSFLDHQPTV